ncbi:hypothetical protein [Dyella choica]|uniref:Uncharacterized protein n=1 Tax=Dyella choica TaxID=1927959 RepID=A0A432LZW1_9GAMM|nr:hypothetical protein [Dyella choica]RUL69529.1 hypothetical protein EKH80_22190 [Dyella choica]
MARSKPVVGLALLCMTGAVLAANPPGHVVSQVVSSPPATQPPMVDGFGPAVNAGTLQRYSGGNSLVQNNQTLTGTVTGDTASQVSTGTNSIGGGAFSGAAGLPSVVQNTGNNVLIQNAVIVNVQLKP